MNLLFVIDRYFPFGGLQQDMLRLAYACVERGHAVTILLGQWDGPKPDHERIGVVEISLRAWTNQGRMRRLAEHLRRMKVAADDAVVVGFKKLPGLDVYFAGDACLAATLAEHKPRWAHRLPRYRAFLANERAVFAKDADTEILLLSPKQRDQFTAHYQTPLGRLHLLPPGIHRGRLQVNQSKEVLRGQVRSELGLSGDALLLLSVGSSFRTKGVDRAIDALHALSSRVGRTSGSGEEAQAKSEVHLAIIGQGKAGPMRRLARRLGVDAQVHLLGGRKDVARFYHAADLLVHPARTENTGTVILEAMVCQLPVLVSGTCGYAAYVREAGAGLVCDEPYDPGHFAQLLTQALDADRRAQWASKAQRYAQANALTGMVSQAAEIILGRGHARGGGDQV